MIPRFILLLFLLIGANPSYALDKTSTGFFYPLESFTYSASGRWLGPGLGHAGPNGHIGVDMLAVKGSPVFAIYDGDVQSNSLNGWGAGNVGVWINHRIGNGVIVKVLYGHIDQNTSVKSGRVKAGDIIGRIGNYDEPHLHFGVVDPGKDPEAPYGYTSDADHNHFIDPIAFIRDNFPYTGGEPVTVCAWRNALERVCWRTRSDEDRSCENARSWYVENAIGKTSIPANASVCLSSCYGGPTVSSILDFLIQPAYAGGTLSSCAKRETGEDYVFGNSSPGSGSATPATDSPQSGKPDFVGKSIRLYDTSGVERYTFKKTEEIKMRGRLSNDGSANIPSDKKVKSMFLLSKGYKEDPHGDWQKNER